MSQNFAALCTVGLLALAGLVMVSYFADPAANDVVIERQEGVSRFVRIRMPRLHPRTTEASFVPSLPTSAALPPRAHSVQRLPPSFMSRFSQGPTSTRNVRTNRYPTQRSKLDSDPRRFKEFPVPLDERPINVLVAGTGVGSLVLAHLLILGGVNVRVLADPADIRVPQQMIYLDKTTLQVLKLVSPNIYSKIRNKLRLVPAHNGGFREGATGEWIVHFETDVEAKQREFSPSMLTTISHTDLQSILLKSLPKGALEVNPVVDYVPRQTGDSVIVKTGNGDLYDADVLIGSKSEWKTNIFEPTQYAGVLVVSGVCDLKDLPQGLFTPDELEGIYLGDDEFVVVSDAGNNQVEWRAFVPYDPITMTFFGSPNLFTPEDSSAPSAWDYDEKILRERWDSTEDDMRQKVPSVSETMRFLKSANSPFHQWTPEVTKVIWATRANTIEQGLLFENPVQPEDPEGPVMMIDEVNPSQAIVDAYDMFGRFVGLDNDIADLESLSPHELRDVVSKMLDDEPVLTKRKLPMSALDMEVYDFFLKAGVFEGRLDMKKK